MTDRGGKGIQKGKKLRGQQGKGVVPGNWEG